MLPGISDLDMNLQWGYQMVVTACCCIFPLTQAVLGSVCILEYLLSRVAGVCQRTSVM